jgi:nitrogen regulatory protein PII
MRQPASRSISKSLVWRYRQSASRASRLLTWGRQTEHTELYSDTEYIVGFILKVNIVAAVTDAVAALAIKTM